MKRSPRAIAAFSLVEIVLALGVAAFCLLAVMAMLPMGLKTQQASVKQTTANSIISQIEGKLRAATRVPPGQEDRTDSKWLLHPHTGGGPWDLPARAKGVGATFESRKRGREATAS